jgi:hypothetical protein
VQLDAHELENPGQSLSVAELCRRAQVSKSNLYEAHPALVKEIRGNRGAAKKPASAAAKAKDPVDAVARLQKRNHALLYLCFELQQELRMLRARLARVQKPRRK